MDKPNEFHYANLNEQAMRVMSYQQQIIQRQPQLQQYENPNLHQNQNPQQPPPQNRRQYGCPCGKTYLSYPALFTHVKQKHDGRAPGKLIKPKTDKARGRPKIHVEVPQDDMSDGALNLEEQIQNAIFDVSVDYNEKISTSDGYRTCQDMATSFISKLSFLNEDNLKIIHCFLNLLRHTVNEKLGEKHWTEEKPTQIIDMINDMCRNHEKTKQKFPLEKEVVISLVYVLFRWMYKSKWTDHKLIRRSPSHCLTKA